MSVYYIDTVNGKKGNDGLSEETPVSDYRSIDLKSGDTVLFKRNTVIRGKLHNIEGEDGKPITYAAYGVGEKPTFCGSINLSKQELWNKEAENIWVCRLDDDAEAGNLIFNNAQQFGTLRWSKQELIRQGDFFDNWFGVYNRCTKKQEEHKIYIYSAENPAIYYDDIECAVCNSTSLANGGHNMIIRDLRFINNALHGIAGEKPSKNLVVQNCSFECIGGAVYDTKRKIRYGNAVECWNGADNVRIEGCIFNNIYDSGVTHQGAGDVCRPADNYIVHNNIFIKCGMAAYEQRDRLPKYGVFSNNICVAAGEGFSALGENMPRGSEIWPQPMGHHIFLWRINAPTQDGRLEVKGNIFCSAPYGAMIYSNLCGAAEDQIELEDNIYCPNRFTLAARWHNIEYTQLHDFLRYDKNSRTEEVDTERLISDRLAVCNG